MEIEEGLRLAHFVVPYDPEWSNDEWFVAACKCFYIGNKFLVMVEKRMLNAHVHFQGYVAHGDSMMEKNQREAFKTHYMRKARQGPNPYEKKKLVRNVRRPVDDKGFQYIVKEENWKHNVLAVNRMDEEELQQLHDDSEAHVDNLKNGLRNYLYTLHTEGEPPFIVHEIYLDGAAKYYIDQNKNTPPQIGSLVLNAMLHKKPTNPEWSGYAIRHLARHVRSI